MIEKIILKKSCVLDKMPTADQLDFGEIALNYNAEHPFLSFKDSDGDIMLLGDYDEDINYLYGNKLDASYYDEFTNGIRQNATDIARLKKTSVTEVDLIVERKDRRQELADAKKELNASIAEKLNITDFNTFKADNTKTINSLHSNITQNASEIQQINKVLLNHADTINDHNYMIAEKVDKTELAKYAKLDDTGQTITADKITVNDVNIQGESLLDGIENIFGEFSTVLDTKADKTQLASYAKLDDTGQTITANKLNADDVNLQGFSVNNLFDTVRENLRINTEYIGNVEQSVITNTNTLKTHTQQIATLNTKVAELESKTPEIDLSEYAKKTDIPPQEIYVGDSATAPSTAKMAIDPTEDIMEISQELGTSTTNVISQKAITDNINALITRIEKLEKALNSK